MSKRIKLFPHKLRILTIQKRKKDHVDLTVEDQSAYQKKTGFEKYEFIHNALPEIDLDQVSLTSEFLGREFSFPLFISSMTGGYSEAGAVNRIIASFCEKNNLPFGVGSQRAMLEDHSLSDTFSVVREAAPTAFIAANIGGAQLIGHLDNENIDYLTESIRADAIIVHLNPLQELMQPEGDRHFEGIQDGIASLIVNTDLPVIVKETGAGINTETAIRLLSMGVQVIDVAGAGGTSWAKVENLRKAEMDVDEQFNEWGNPTVQCIQEIEKLRNRFRFHLIASGGIRSSFDILKSLALGADFTAVAQPVIQSVVKQGEKGLEALIGQWIKEARMILTLTGCRSVKELNQKHLREIQS